MTSEEAAETDEGEDRKHGTKNAKGYGCKKTY
jgi:hypothetical protein